MGMFNRLREDRGTAAALLIAGVVAVGGAGVVGGGLVQAVGGSSTEAPANSNSSVINYGSNSR